MKAALEKAGRELDFEPIQEALSSGSLMPSSSLFDRFQLISLDDSWKTWMDEKVLFLGIFISIVMYKGAVGLQLRARIKTNKKKKKPN